MTDGDRPTVRRLESAAEVTAALRRIAADSVTAVPDRGLVVERGGSPALVLGLARSYPRLAPTPVRAAELRVAPIAAASGSGGDAVRAAATAALRELMVAGTDWHVLRLVGAPDPVVDAAWRLAADLGFAASVTREPPPGRAPDGGMTAGPVVVALYSPRLKGRWLRAGDAGIGAMVGGAARERVRAIAGRRRGSAPASDSDAGSRFYVLELAAAPVTPTWRPDVTFREVDAAEAEAEPLRYCTSVRRLHEALRRGDRAFATYVDGRLAHTHWVSTDDTFLRRMLPTRALDRPIAHPFDSYTFPEFRGRGLQAATHHWLALRYREEGIARFVVRITASNAASIRGVRKAGYVELDAIPGD